MCLRFPDIATLSTPASDRRRRRLADDESGAALIEMALATPLMVIMVLGIMQFGILMHANTTLNESVRVASRTVALMRGNADPCTTTANKLRSAATGLTLASISITVTVNGTAYGPAAIPSCSGAGTSMTSGADAIVRATYPCSAFVYATNYIPSCTLTAQTTVRVE